MAAHKIVVFDIITLIIMIEAENFCKWDGFQFSTDWLREHQGLNGLMSIEGHNILRPLINPPAR